MRPFVGGFHPINLIDDNDPGEETFFFFSLLLFSIRIKLHF